MNPYAPPFQSMYCYPISLQQQQQQQQQNQNIFQPQMMMHQDYSQSHFLSQQQQQQPEQHNLPQQFEQQQLLQQDIISNNLLERMYAHTNPGAVFEVQIGLEQIVYESHEYETWANAIRDRLTRSDIHDEDLDLAADIIIEMGVSINNCQYNFSKLCQLLNCHIRSFATNCLVPELNEFVYQHSNNQYCSYLSDQELQNFVLFLAELYDKIEINGVRLTQLAALIIDQMNTLLNYHPTHDAIVKTAIQVLKLIGRFLEANQGPEPLNEIFYLINELCYNSKDLSENIKNQILALKQLRQNEWGVCSIPEPSSSNQSNNIPANSYTELIIGPDGLPLSAEECDFLEENCQLAGSNSPFSSWNDALEDDEVLEDYEKFLQDTAIRAAEKALEKLSFEDDDVESIAYGMFSGSSPNNEERKIEETKKTQVPQSSNEIFIVKKEKPKNKPLIAASPTNDLTETPEKILTIEKPKD